MGKYLTDVIMSNEKTTLDSVSAKPFARGHASVAGSKRPVKEAEVTALSIDENDDFGSDPYNRTGSHCVLKIEDDR